MDNTSKEQIKKFLLSHINKPYPFSYSSFDDFFAQERKYQHGHHSHSNDYDYPCPHCLGSGYTYDSFHGEHDPCDHCFYEASCEPGNSSKEYYLEYYNKIYIDHIDRLNTYSNNISNIDKIIDKLTIEELQTIFSIIKKK
jgi:hypothetical protein